MRGMTVWSAKWGNPDKTAILLETEERGWVLLTEDKDDDIWPEVLQLAGVEDWQLRQPKPQRDLEAELDQLLQRIAVLEAKQPEPEVRPQ